MDRAQSSSVFGVWGAWRTRGGFVSYLFHENDGIPHPGSWSHRTPMHERDQGEKDRKTARKREREKRGTIHSVRISSRCLKLGTNQTCSSERTKLGRNAESAPQTEYSPAPRRERGRDPILAYFVEKGRSTELPREKSGAS